MTTAMTEAPAAEPAAVDAGPEARTLEDLGWPRLIEHLAARTHTERGRRAAESVALLDEPAAARRRSDEIAEARALRVADAALPFGGIRDVRVAIARARKGGVLEPEELVAVGDTGRGLDRLRRHLRARAQEAPLLAQVGEAIADLGHVYQPILESFDADGRLADHASDELGPLRRRASQLQQQLERRMRELVEDPRYADNLQDRYYTVREERFVVPVRAGARAWMKGIVHGTSQSGQTLFIEPDEVVDLGNQVKMAGYAVADEERRILARLSGYVAEEADSIEAALDATEHLDLIAAAATLAEDLDAQPVAVGGAEDMALMQARHPLMVVTGRPCVPNDITLSRGGTLILSGPNAGGKTVALKIVGLLALMARAGLHLPVAAGSAMPWFGVIHSDIGDAQSLENDLSTFSAHLMVLRRLLDESDSDALLLLDEVAVGTEPEQGAALAQAVLEHLAERGATTVVTTHYERLKVLGASDARFANASVGFDLERMEPTFQLHLGVPGSSGALAVARKMGLAPGVLDRAESLLGDRRAELEHLLAELAGQRLELEEQRQRVAAELAEAERARRGAESAHQAARQREKRLREGAHDEAVAALRKARAELEHVRAAVKRRGADGSLRDARKRLDQISAEVFEHAPKAPAPPGRPLSAAELVPGTPVVVKSLGARGHIATAPERGRVTVQIGNLRSTVDVDDVLGDLHRQARQPQTNDRRKPKPGPTAPKPQPRPNAEAPIRTPDITLDVRGSRVDEAIAELDRFLDQSLLAENEVIYIIHGHGTGALRSALRQHLSAHPLITRHRPGAPEEGGNGVTLAWLSP